MPQRTSATAKPQAAALKPEFMAKSIGKPTAGLQSLRLEGSNHCGFADTSSGIAHFTWAFHMQGTAVLPE
jgi:hypothetical protein